MFEVNHANYLEDNLEGDICHTGLLVLAQAGVVKRYLDVASEIPLEDSGKELYLSQREHSSSIGSTESIEEHSTSIGSTESIEEHSTSIGSTDVH